eukprot:1150002-Pelagomonas_calceolata.AAC.1
MHSIQTPTQVNVLPSTQNVNPGDKDTLTTPPGDGSTISANLLGIRRVNPEDGPPSKRTHSSKKQESRYTSQQCSQDTSKPSINQHNTLPETLRTCPQTEKILPTRSTEPDSEPPKKRKSSRYRPSITPPVHLTHNLLLNTTQSNALPPSPDVNPQPRNDLNTPPGDAPNIRANLPGLQTELPEDWSPSKRTRSTKRHDSRFTPQQCS